MVSKDTLSADLDLVKEIEQLRIKQKLLIDSLNRKNKDDKNQQLSDMSSKIDFIVEIFKDASSDDSSSHKDKDEETPVVDPSDDKLSEILTLLETRFDAIDSKISKIEKVVTKSPTPPVPSFHNEDAPRSSNPKDKSFSLSSKTGQKTMGGPGSNNSDENGGAKKKKGFFSK